MEEEEELGLEPFIHQVGGHSPLFCLDPGTVCKPYVQREHNFYSSLPSALQPFIPHYKGCMKVQISEDEEGYILLKGYPPRSYRTSHHSPTKPKMRLKRCGSIEIESEIPSDQCFEDELVKGERGYNPWALKCHRDNLKKVGIHLVRRKDCDDVETLPFQEYILLENITSSYHYPCVLDLKVGTRQYGDGASAGKKQSKNAKVAGTTSGTLGLRLGGMQVYQACLGRYICRTKNFGRGLSVQGLKLALRQFFCNGLVMRTDVIRGLIRKLKELRNVLAQLDSFRFYTSSLLVTYDGCQDKSGLCSRFCPGEERRTRNSLSTGSILLMSEKGGSGLRVRAARKTVSLGEIARYHRGLNNTSKLSARKRSLSWDSIVSPGGTSLTLATTIKSREDNLVQEQQAVATVTSPPKSVRPASVLPAYPQLNLYDVVDVRMIDFAHSTHCGLKDATVHEGPDQGFLFGLDNFIEILNELAL